MAVTADKVIVELQAKVEQHKRDVGVATASFQRNMRNMEVSATRAEREITRSMARAGATFKNFAAGALAGLIGPQLIGQVGQLVKQVADLADEAKRAGVAVEDLQGLGQAAELAGSSMAEMTDLLQKFNVEIGQAATKGGQLADLFKLNGVSIRDQNGQIKDTLTLFYEFVDLIKNARTQQEKATIAQMGFGREAQNALPFLSQGAEALKQSVQHAKDTGNIIREDMVKAADEFDDAWTRVMRALSNNIKTELVAAFREVLDVALKIDRILREYTGKGLFMKPLDEMLGLRNLPPMTGVQPGLSNNPYSASSSSLNSIQSYVNRVASAESGGNATARNPQSSATGLGQFIESTWLRMFRQYFPDRAAGMTQSAILALRNDAATSRQMIELYARENAQALQRAGVAVTEANLHLAHFLGPQGAINMNRAPRGDLAARYLSPRAVSANQTILGNGATVADVLAYAERRAGGPSSSAGTGYPGRGSTDPTILPQRSNLSPSNAHVLDYEKEVERKKKLIAELLKGHERQIELINGETAALAKGKTEAEAYRIAQEAINDLMREGIEVTPELRKQIEELAQMQAQAAESQEKFVQAQQLTVEQMDSIRSTASDVLGGFIRDIRSGVSVTEALSNALDKVIDRLIDVGVNWLVSGLFGATGSSGGGILGSLFGFADGGVMTQQGPRQLKKFARGGVSRKAAIFGETGQPEAAVPLPDGRRIPVEISMPDMPSHRARQSMNDGMHITFGVSTDKNGNLLPFVESVSRRVSKRVASQLDRGVLYTASKQAPKRMDSHNKLGT